MTQNPDPDWNDLRPFLALAREGSLAGAARAMGTRHSTVSRRIDALELALGTRLVHRASGGAALTGAGERLLPLAVTAERAMQAFTAAARNDARPLRLALPSGFAPLLTAALADLQGRVPGMAVEVISSSRPADLTGGEADIAVRIGPVADPGLITRTVGRAGWSLYASPAYLAEHPVNADPADLTGHRVIGFHAGLAGSPPDRWLAEHGTGAEIVLRLAQMTDLVDTARQGLGAALLPCVLADAALGLQRLTPRVLVSQPVALVCRRDVAEDTSGRRLITRIIRALKQAEQVLQGEGR